MKNQNSIVCIKKNKADTEGYLFLRRKGKENRTKLSLKLKVNFLQFQKYWNDKEQCFKSGMSNYKLYNEQIQEALNKLEEHKGDIVELSKSDKSFLVFWQHKIDTETNHGTRQKNTTIINKFKKYLISIGKTDLSYSELTPAFLDKLQCTIRFKPVFHFL